MATPPEYKTIKVSPEVHRKIHTIANDMNTTADGAIAFLLGVSTVRVPVSDVQRDRWKAAAEAAGVSLAEFVVLRVESAIQYTGDPQAFKTIYDHVFAIAYHQGLTPVRAAPLPRQVPSTSTGGTPPK
jgi:predicted transcriptional regulator